MNVAAIDIGTNSVRLLLVEKDGKRIIARKKQVEMTRIGKDVDKTGVLRQDRMDDTLAVLIDYKAQLTAYGIKQCSVFATSAVRDAANREVFLKRVKEETGFEVTVLTGVEEAAYGFRGVGMGADVKSDNLLVIDIGGGSTEVVYGTASGDIMLAHSFDIGAVRMTDRYKLGHGIDYSEVLMMKNDIIEQFKGSMLDSIDSSSISVICIGGTATTLGAIDLKMTEYNANRIQNYEIEYDKIKNIATDLATMTRQEKLALRGLADKRVDIIVAGAVILETIISYLAQDKIVLSDYDNLEGSLFIS